MPPGACAGVPVGSLVVVVDRSEGKGPAPTFALPPGAVVGLGYARWIQLPKS